MSSKFEDFKVTDLYLFAKKKEIKVPFGRNRIVISELLTKNGFVEAEVEAFLKAQDEFGFNNDNEERAGYEKESLPVFDIPDNVLVKMNRGNSVFEFSHYRFTKKHPIALMKTEDAKRLIEKYDGFYISTPEQAKEFYSK